ncbi:ROK family protein [Vibrio gazogenes]|uniref:fructokinase n=1 Tax=Vibrio gazogenes DSM 21264 = NBRC 103151 TaxID=1123492 RepID=A0A1M4SC88_VIBGA|nr:ROK family protein [Vibrio gazogenes]USP15832.1 ROK family protein [Vibrio gazogenes]SHE29809.1 fructokinase [Vibrio gazogenes DSM 21264] [Vibrio gazogenes DSM 21264 = NBRC 103151]SJN58226.1 Putative fructokinase [Vibrio gazogenes]
MLDTFMLGAIEAGGTKFIAAVSDQDLNVIDKISVPTTDPGQTLGKIADFFSSYPIAAMGVGCFGPLDLNLSSPTYGYIESTPKLAWKGFNILGALQAQYRIPISLNTDVNVAALGELKRGAAVGEQSCIYITVGTGIGGGVIVNQQIFNGYHHPELGHIAVKRFPSDTFAGICPYHTDCLEGLASGPALAERAHQAPNQIGKDDPLWEVEAYYLAQAIVTYSLILSPAKIILGGGVMQQEHVLEMVKASVKQQLNHYIQIPDIDRYIVRPQLKNEAAIIGGFILAKDALRLG